VTSTSLSRDFHQHGPLKEYEELDISKLLRCSRKAAKYTLRAAIMYSARHHWVCMHGQTWVYISDDISRIATLNDVHRMAQCARILIYERTPPSSLARTNGSATATTANAATAARVQRPPRRTANEAAEPEWNTSPTMTPPEKPGLASLGSD
jgi:hypothetical protein